MAGRGAQRVWRDAVGRDGKGMVMSCALYTADKLRKALAALKRGGGKKC